MLRKFGLFTLLFTSYLAFAQGLETLQERVTQHERRINAIEVADVTIGTQLNLTSIHLTHLDDKLTELQEEDRWITALLTAILIAIVGNTVYGGFKYKQFMRDRMHLKSKAAGAN